MKKEIILEHITSQILEQLKKGVNPWVKPWSTSGTATDDAECFAVNYISRKPYQGINATLLEPGYYATFKQAIGAGGRPSKGKSHKVIFMADVKDKVEDKEEKEIVMAKFHEKYEKMEEGKEYFIVFNKTKYTYKDGALSKTFKMMKAYDVWNILDCGIAMPEKPKAEPEKPTEKPIERAEKTIREYIKKQSLAKFAEDGRNECYYQPSTDEVHVPNRKQFRSIREFYSSAFHELIHSTGAEKRLNRDGITKSDRFGGQKYSKEELIAEIGSAFTMGCMKISTEGTLENSADYLASWAENIEADKTLAEKIVYATSDAKKAFVMLMGGAK